MKLPLSVYIHIPFCATKCGYCDFYSVCGTDRGTREKLTDCLCAEISSFFSSYGNYEIETVYIGGGTPNSLEPELFGRILRQIRSAASGGAIKEWSVEANPEFISERFLELCSANGVTRLSMGIQSFQDGILKFLERKAGAGTVRLALETIGKHWRGDVSFDLIYAVPGQTMAELEQDIRGVLDYSPGHVSFYTLTIEPGTRLGKALDGGGFSETTGDSAAAFYQRAVSLLEGGGYRHYEISNFARPGKTCLHNLTYWYYNLYAGFGPAAAGTISVNGKIFRTENPKDLSAYINGVRHIERLPPADILKEQLMMNFRLDSGLDRGGIRRRFGLDLEDICPRSFEKWKGAGLLRENSSSLYLSERGRLLLDAFLADLFFELDDEKIHLKQFP